MFQEAPPTAKQTLARLQFVSALALMLVGWALPGGSLAQEAQETPEEASTVAVLSLGGDASEALSQEGRQLLAEALTAEGESVLSAATLSMQVSPARLRSCRSAPCAHQLGTEAGAAWVAALSVWTAEGQASEVNISLILSPERTFTGSAPIADTDLSAAISAALRTAMNSRRRALLLGGGMPSLDDDADTSPLLNVEAADENSELEDMVLPILLGTMGLALTGTAVYALLEETCERRAGSGLCLRGSNPNVGLGVVMVSLGALSIGGAILWLAFGGRPAQMGNIDLVLGPDGGGLRARGRF